MGALSPNPAPATAAAAATTVVPAHGLLLLLLLPLLLLLLSLALPPAPLAPLAMGGEWPGISIIAATIQIDSDPPGDKARQLALGGRGRAPADLLCHNGSPLVLEEGEHGCLHLQFTHHHIFHSTGSRLVKGTVLPPNCKLLPLRISGPQPSHPFRQVLPLALLWAPRQFCLGPESGGPPLLGLLLLLLLLLLWWLFTRARRSWL